LRELQSVLSLTLGQAARLGFRMV